MRTEDGRLIQECLNGETEAFGVLVDKYKAGIYAFVCGKLRDFRDAEDVTQEVFVEAYSGLRGLRRWESFAFWLYRIAFTHCRKWLRTRSRRPDSEFVEDQDPEILEASSMYSYRESQASDSLEEALNSLPETYRQVIMLYYFGGMSNNEIATAIGTSPGAVRVRLSRARAQLREEMVAMMGTAFEGESLQASFTFRIVEAVKRVKIHPMPRTAGLPWGLSLAVGIIITVLSLNPHMNIPSDIATSTGSPLPAEAKVLETGEIPVDVWKIAQVSTISSKQGDDRDGPEFLGLQNAMLLAPHREGDTWTRKADMPTPRNSLSTSMVNEKIYAIGGIGLGWKVLSTVEEYDPKTDTWTKKADMPTQGFSLSTSAVNGKIYTIGGGWRWSTVEEYDPKTDTWKGKSDIPTGRQNLATDVVSGKIYTIGGVDRTCAVYFPTVEEYDPTADKWTKKADMPTARAGLSISAVNGKIYAIGGCDPAAVLSTVEEYDPKTDTWKEKSEMPTARFFLSTSVVNGKIYAIGGESKVANVGVPTVEIYDPATDMWTKGPDMPTARRHLSTSAVNGDIYAIGGDTVANRFLSITQVYDTGFAVEPKGKLPTKWSEVKSE